MSLHAVPKSHFDFYGVRVPHEDEALEFCRKNKIYIVHDRRQKFGKLKRYKGFVFLLINPKLEKGWRLWVLWHEIAHFIFGHPSGNFSINFTDKHDREANFVAATTLITFEMITTMPFAEIQEEYGYPIELIKIRDTIAEREKSKEGRFMQYKAA